VDLPDSINRGLLRIYLFNPNPFNALLRDLLAEFEVKPASDESNKMIAQLHRCLIDQYRKGRNVTLIIDEAQNMPLPTLESLACYQPGNHQGKTPADCPGRTAETGGHVCTP
jgi:type II secretory pathway predicted ATPase ExeA